MKIHVITPFYRKQLLPVLIGYLAPFDVEWHPVCDPIDIRAFENNNYKWIHPLLCKPFCPSDMCYRKINDFIDAGNIIDGDYYSFMCDDDMYEPRFFNVIREQTKKIIFHSCCRGDTIPNIPGAENHPVYPLIINTPDDIRVCNIGLGMYIIKGDILKQIRFSNIDKWGDGMMAVELKTRWPNDFIIISDLFVFGNYFEPGRFTTKESFIKSNWELPKAT
jgi:hypothetical protein